MELFSIYFFSTFCQLSMPVGGQQTGGTVFVKHGHMYSFLEKSICYDNEY